MSELVLVYSLGLVVECWSSQQDAGQRNAKVLRDQLFKDRFPADVSLLRVVFCCFCECGVIINRAFGVQV